MRTPWSPISIDQLNTVNQQKFLGVTTATVMVAALENIFSRKLLPSSPCLAEVGTKLWTLDSDS